MHDLDSLVVRVGGEKSCVSFGFKSDFGVGEIKYTAKENNEEKKVLVNCKKSVDQEFATRYSGLFTRATSLSKTVTLKFTQGTVMRKHFFNHKNMYIQLRPYSTCINCIPSQHENTFANGFGKLTFYLAAKIDDDDED